MTMHTRAAWSGTFFCLVAVNLYIYPYSISLHVAVDLSIWQNSGTAWVYSIYADADMRRDAFEKWKGFSVRCVKD